jgi:hypothetical protein
MLWSMLSGDDYVVEHVVDHVVWRRLCRGACSNPKHGLPRELVNLCFNSPKIIKLQTSAPEGAKGRTARENKWFEAHVRPPPQREHRFGTKTLQMRRAGGDTP